MMPIVVMVGVLATLAGGRTAAPAAWGRIEPGPTAPNADWLDDVIDDLEDIDDNLDDAEETVNGQPGPLTGTDLQTVETNLYDTLAIIDRILDPAQYPSLDHVDAGAIDYGVSPDTLPKYADECLGLIQEAIYGARTGADDDYIGSRLKTIEYLINRIDPHGYKSLAGVE